MLVISLGQIGQPPLQKLHGVLSLMSNGSLSHPCWSVVIPCCVTALASLFTVTDIYPGDPQDVRSSTWSQCWLLTRSPGDHDLCSQENQEAKGQGLCLARLEMAEQVMIWKQRGASDSALETLSRPYLWSSGCWAADIMATFSGAHCWHLPLSGHSSLWLGPGESGLHSTLAQPQRCCLSHTQNRYRL